MYTKTTVGRPPSYAPNGMVSTPHTLASSAGLNALRRGGSAVDAAIAANATTCVAYPHMSGLGGDGFWLLVDRHGTATGINASGPAGSEATRSFYDGVDAIPERGADSALTVPGAVDGWRIAHAEYGRLPWEELFVDAIELATDGVPVTETLAYWIDQNEAMLAADEQASETFLRDNTPPAPGERLRQPELANSLTAIATEGPRAGFYEGDIAERFCAGLDGSPLQPDDFSAYCAERVDPISTTYGEYTVLGLPPNSQGLAALEILGMLDGFDVTAWGDGTADYYHHLTEIIKLAFADRDAWVTDPETVTVPTDTLLSVPYLTTRRNLVSADTALPPAPAPGLTPPPLGRRDSPTGRDTCSFSIVDADGLAVSMIQSIYFDFGSGVVAGDTGIVPQNRGSSFSLDPDSINTLEPGKRTFHTLTPILLTESGSPRLVCGAKGGEGQPQTLAALVSRIVDFGYNVQEAIEAPRWVFGRTWGAQSESLSVEGRVPDHVVSELEGRGHTVSIGRNYDETMGHAQAIYIHPNGTLEGGADPRGDGAAIGH
jgi:gamma-glutamyltranspeptidase/glutathione hydrolase